MRTTIEAMVTRAERWTQLLDMLGRQGALEVHAAAEALGISTATVRRDLDRLAEQQLLVRTRGGALPNALSYDLPLRYKSVRQVDEKARIGKLAADLVPLGAVVGLNGGTTTTEVARALGRRSDLRSADGQPTVTVVTNALNIANELVIRPSVKVVVAGGVARPQSYELIGPLTPLTLAELHLDFLMLGVDALDPDLGAFAHHEGEAAINQLMVRQARSVVVVADSTKLGRHAFVRICPLDQIDVVVTDDAATPEAVHKLEAAGLRVLLAQSDREKAVAG